MNRETLAGIVRRARIEERRRGAVEDTFGPIAHSRSDGRGGHDDYDCAAADRRALLGSMRKAGALRRTVEKVIPTLEHWNTHGQGAGWNPYTEPHAPTCPPCLLRAAIARLAVLEGREPA